MPVTLRSLIRSLLPGSAAAAEAAVDHRPRRDPYHRADLYRLDRALTAWTAAEQPASTGGTAATTTGVVPGAGCRPRTGGGCRTGLRGTGLHLGLRPMPSESRPVPSKCRVQRPKPLPRFCDRPWTGAEHAQKILVRQTMSGAGPRLCRTYEVHVGTRRRRAALTLILGSDAAAPVRVLRRAGQTQNAQLADFHSRP